MVNQETFEDQLRDGLHHLYDPDALRASPLAAYFGVADRYDTASALRRILTEAIAALEPATGDPPQSHTWRMYNALQYLYVEQMTQQEAADQLGLSDRQLRREQRAAIQALAQLLWSRYHLEADPGDPSASLTCAEVPLQREFAWLGESASGASTNPSEVLPALLEIAEGLAAQHKVHLSLSVSPHLPHMAVHPIAFRQAFLSLCSAVIPRAPEGSVHIALVPGQWALTVRIYCPRHPQVLKPALADESDCLNVVHQLAVLSRGRLTLAVDARSFDAVLELPLLEQLSVLVVDDNSDTLQLLQRYATGSRYRLVTTRNPVEALTLAAQHSPQVIVLDVMMPEVDGWEMLGQLRSDPRTAATPILVCTILPQRDLAFFLGASAYLRKPVTQQDFLAALDQLATVSEPASR